MDMHELAELEARHEYEATQAAYLRLLERRAHVRAFLHHLRYLKPWPLTSVEGSGAAVPAPGGTAHPPTGVGSGATGSEAHMPPVSPTPPVMGSRLPGTTGPDQPAPSAGANPPGPVGPHLTPFRIAAAGITWN